MKRSECYDAVVFDMDGIIFDSEKAVLDCWLEVAANHGVENFEKPYYACIGTTKAKTKEILCAAFGADFPYEAYDAEKSALYHKTYDGGRLPLKPGVREILSYLKAEGKKIGLASSTRRQTVLPQLRDAGILGYFDEIICGDMIEKSKPAPDIFLRACEMLGAQPSRTYAFEDSYNGVRAACAGALRAIMVPDLLPATDEMRALSEAVFRNLNEALVYLRQ